MTPLSHASLRGKVTDTSRTDQSQRPIELILLRQLASYLDMPIFVIDAQGRLVYYNEPAEPLLGVRFDEVGVMEMADWLALSPRVVTGIDWHRSNRASGHCRAR